jgi:hypothetical protein
LFLYAVFKVLSLSTGSAASAASSSKADVNLLQEQTQINFFPPAYLSPAQEILLE